jgi:allantoinase
MKLAIVNGTLVTEQGRRRADVLCQDGRIVEVADGGLSHQADEREDAAGLLVFPGFIDPHIHSRDPGLTEKEDFAHATRAAAAGGITTVFDMPNALPALTDAVVFQERAASHGRVAFTDFGLWGLSLGRENLAELGGLLDAGVVGIKLFLGYAFLKASRRLLYEVDGFQPSELVAPPTSDEVRQVMEAVASKGGLVAAHCEDRGVIDSRTRLLGHAATTYDELLYQRPDLAEATSMAAMMELARTARCRFHVLHVSSAAGVRVLEPALEHGERVTAETCPHFLTLTAESFERLGSRLKVFPPVRRAPDQEALLAALSRGSIASLGSDHAPHTVEEKALPLDRAPAGMLGVETLVPLMLNLMHAGTITPERLASVLATGTARLYGLYPQKGAIVEGADADFTIVDPQGRWTIRAERLHSKQRWSAWDGQEVTGRPRATVLRGQVIARDGEPVGEPRGRLVTPGP